MKINIVFFSFILISQFSYSQITLESNTLPDVGDVLEYTSFTDFQDTVSYRTNGEDLNWTYDNFNINGTLEEAYLDILGTPLADSFPNANMILSLGGFEAAALRTDNTIEVIGIPEIGIAGLPIDIATQLDDPFLLRVTPFSFGDKIEDSFSFGLQFSSELIPGLDSIEIPLPGATLDSVRVNTRVFKSEEATAWGNLNLNGTDIEVLKIEQLDSTTISIEIGLNFFGNIIWLDIADLLGDQGLPSGNTSLTYKFMSADSKASIVEFTENRIADSLGVETLTITGRISSDFISSSENLVQTEEVFKIYPNPSKGIIRIHSNSFNDKIDRLTILNLEGKALMVINNYNIGNDININKLISGQYFIKFIKGEKQFIKALNIID